jgi:hypothetical protein
MITILTVVLIGSLVATWAKHKAKTWTAPDHTLAHRLADANSVRM